MCKCIFESVNYYLKYYDIFKCLKIIPKRYSLEITSEMEQISSIFNDQIVYNLGILNLTFIEIIYLSLIYFE